jgi:hypothetical protein
MAERVIAQRKFTKVIDGGATKVTIKAELTDLGQGAYFSMTFTESERVGRGPSAYYRECCWGAGVERFAEHFPEVKQFTKWHLVNVNRGPMHYMANALYWAGCQGWCDGKPNSPPNWDHFRSTIVWGGASTDKRNTNNLREAFDARNAPRIKELLNRRFERLMNAFDADMNTLFGAGTITQRAA